MKNIYNGTRGRDEHLEVLANTAKRLGIAPSDVRIRPLAGSAKGLTLTFSVGDTPLTRNCDSQPTRDQNLACLALWFQDLVRNVERRIERLDEAFRAEGMKALPSGHEDSARYGKTRESLYRGDMAPRESGQIIERSLERLGLRMDDCKVTWGSDPCRAQLRLRLKSGRVMEKVSDRQDTAERNLAALALWLETRAKNFEREIETDHEQLFAANLLPAGPGR